MELDNEELRATKELNGADIIIELNSKDIDKVIKDLEDWLKVKSPEEYAYGYIKGKIDCLKAIKNGNINDIV